MSDGSAPSDSELKIAADEWLRKSDLENVTTKNLIAQVLLTISIFKKYFILFKLFNSRIDGANF